MSDEKRSLLDGEGWDDAQRSIIEAYELLKQYNWDEYLEVSRRRNSPMALRQLYADSALSFVEAIEDGPNVLNEKNMSDDEESALARMAQLRQEAFEKIWNTTASQGASILEEAQRRLREVPDWDVNAYNLAEDIRRWLEEEKGVTRCDSGMGFGGRDMLPEINGVEYWISVQLSNTERANRGLPRAYKYDDECLEAIKEEARQAARETCADLIEQAAPLAGDDTQAWAQDVARQIREMRRP